MKLCPECGHRPIERRDHKCDQCKLGNEVRYQLARRAAQIRPSVARQVWDDAKGCCEYCGRAVRRKTHRYDSGNDIGEIDHVIPAALGGTGERKNLKLSCKGCNRKREAAARLLVRAHIATKKRQIA